ncbi:MAG: thioredoxin domain-containing protein [Caldilineaceae bacterium]
MTTQTAGIDAPVRLPVHPEAGQNGGEPVVLEVWAPWCGPCRAMAPALAAAEAEFAGSVRLVRVNADEQPERVAALGVRGIPTLILLRDGREVGRHTGLLSPGEVRALFAGLAAGQVATPALGPSQADRTVRMLAAVALAVLGVLIGFNGAAGWLFLALAGGVFFSAIHDRCPLWQAVKRSFGLAEPSAS